jgi:ATP-dependent Clp protease protease subunit
VVTENKGTEEEKTVEVVEPIEFYVSSYGGQATEMFAVYDVMRDVRERTPVITYGIGKVMSAGVLLLAAGTKGQRRIGKNCRVMIHGVVAGQHGHIADIENEFTEVKSTQKMYIDALVEETDMTQRYIKKLMDKKTNVYLDAAEAVNLGIADIII